MTHIPKENRITQIQKNPSGTALDIIDLEKKCEMFWSMIQYLEQEFESRKNSHKIDQSRLQAAHGKLKEVEQNNATLVDELKKERDRNAKLGKFYTNLEDELKNVKDRNAELEKIASLGSELKEAKDRNAELEKQKAKIEEQKASLEDKLREQIDRNTEIGERKARLEDELKEANDAKVALENQNRELKDQVAATTSHHRQSREFQTINDIYMTEPNQDIHELGRHTTQLWHPVEEMTRKARKTKETEKQRSALDRGSSELTLNSDIVSYESSRRDRTRKRSQHSHKHKRNRSYSRARTR